MVCAVKLGVKGSAPRLANPPPTAKVLALKLKSSKSVRRSVPYI
jgi:hypothetical protein